jgi:hypothetical protein
MMEAARTSETSVDNYFTRQYIPEDKSEIHTRRRKNLKSHVIVFLIVFTVIRLTITYVRSETIQIILFSTVNLGDQV